MTPVGARVLVSEADRDEKTEGGIIMPAQTITTTVRCTVVKAGDGCEREYPGEVFIYRPLLGPMVAPNQYIVNEEHILAVE